MKTILKLRALPSTRMRVFKAYYSVFAMIYESHVKLCAVFSFSYFMKTAYKIDHL